MKILFVLWECRQVVFRCVLLTEVYVNLKNAIERLKFGAWVDASLEIKMVCGRK